MTDTPPRWAIILHGGAHQVPRGQEGASRAGCLVALNAGQQILDSGGSAVDAVEAAVRVLEDNPTFNAGYGSDLTADGEVEMCASIMDGNTLDVGAVSVLQGARHPVSVARLLLREEEILLAGPGARRFAAERHAELCDPAELIAPDKQPGQPSSDTVGCLALDADGHLAVAVSTGGLEGQRQGRVGDSPQPGCGFYAEDGVGATALSGDGEQIARMMAAARIMHQLPGVPPEQAVASAVQDIRRRVDGQAGAIALTARGMIGWAHVSPHMPVAYQTAGQAPQVFLSKQEEANDGR
ncbi:isoaspartyl peptidase/L-asparaginase (plasmid) [Deinococcus taeanensis]|uniref:isoaspartyl peptidase/L-asparaginase family protein n=1 Tax=Deinococcus taeanensis TaxID=2737050 RepID=UPI001CDD435F|nr:isoaspartyl peptidase/L-asparaginase family protein [Deinococcus taeanensis]UBV44941.1 isoaspartyl peptidase/L-asparaginase [Deinococcus taeanensis]